MSGMFAGKKGVILGVANEFSIATGIAKYLSDQGAELAFNHLPDKDERGKMGRRVKRATEGLNAKLIMPADATVDSDLDAFFAKVKEEMGDIDFMVHSIAFAPLDDIRCPASEASREGFKIAMDISVYSFMAAATRAAALMPNGGSIATMTYFGGEKVVGGYNLMGICKAALDAAMKYTAYDLGPKKIRVNAVSAGPIKTLASSAVGDFSDMLRLNSSVAPMGENITQEDVAKACAYLLSDLGAAVTGEILHVDYGYNIMGSPGRALEHLAGGEA